MPEDAAAHDDRAIATTAAVRHDAFPRFRHRPGPELIASGALVVERSHEFVRDRPPTAGMKSQQMAVARNVVEKFKAHTAAGRGERLVVFADQSFGVEFVVVGIKPELWNPFRRTAACVRIIRRRHRPVGVPATGEIHHAHHLSRLETGIVHSEKPAA
jgi:hypothetical protein